MRDERWLTDLQIELVAGVTSIKFRAGESEPSLTEGGRSPVPVAHLPQRLLIVGHGVHTLKQKEKMLHEAHGAWLLLSASALPTIY